MNTKKGIELHPDDQKRALSAYVHRFTGEHKPEWASDPRPDGTPYKRQFKDDREWLENTSFVVTKSGRLDKRAKHCQSTSTWN